MPAVYRWRGFRFHFYSDEGDPREPIHVHVTKNDADSKFWLYPDVAVAYNRGFSAKTLAELLEQVERHRDLVERAWDEHFS